MSESTTEVQPEDVGTVLTKEDAKREPTKLELKRYQQHQERVKRMINKGMDPAKVEAAIAEEDYRALPVEKKFDMLMHSVRMAISGFAEDIQGLRFNDQMFSDVMAINSRAMTKCLIKAGISLEVQSDLIKEADAEIRAEFQKRQDERSMELKAKEAAAAAAQEKSIINQLKMAEGSGLPADISNNPPPTIPDGATTFGD